MLYRWMIASLLLGLAVGPGRAQAPFGPIGLAGENSSTARRLAAVDQLIAEHQDGEAVAELLRILDEVGDDLVPLDPQHCVQARWLCHQRLASPALRGLYRERVDGQVKKWWEQAEPTYDVRLLRRIVQEAFCSRYADRALDTLGDLAFERGDFDEAGFWWRLLAPENAHCGPADLVFPDPQVDVARVRAKLILLRLAQRNYAGIEPALQAYATVYGQAQGDLAGRKGRYLDTLQALVRQPPILAPVRADPPWTTFAGDSSRNPSIPKAPDLDLVEQPPLPLGDGIARGRDPGPVKLSTLVPPGQMLPYYPVIASGQVLVAGPRWVIGYDLLSGRPSGRYDLPENRDDRFAPIPPGCRYTLTVADKHIYVRLGNPAIIGLGNIRPQKIGADSFLVCLDLQADRVGKFPLRWIVAAPAPKGEKERTVFEGSPLVHEGRVYVARSRVTGTQVATAIDCYSAARGTLHWHQEVCETRELSDGAPRIHQHLLTLAGPNVVYCSQSGAIVAVDTITGRRAWAVRYASRGLTTSQGRPSPRDLAPCVYANGRLFAAPADTDHLFCLEAATGQPLWESQPVEVVHLLGVARDKLVFTTEHGIQAADAVTGQVLIDWITPATGGNLPSLGRGLLAGDKVYWPTWESQADRPNHLFVLNQEDGQPDASDNYYFSQRFGRALGNLAFGEGCLAVASADQLRVFVPARGQTKGQRTDAIGAARPGAAGGNRPRGLHPNVTELTPFPHIPL